jgi:hypothetical protein
MTPATTTDSRHLVQRYEAYRLEVKTALVIAHKAEPMAATTAASLDEVAVYFIYGGKPEMCAEVLANKYHDLLFTNPQP